MRNTKIKQFNENIVGYINHELSQGLDISTVVLCLEKCIADAKLIERDVIENEQKAAKREAQMKEFQEHLAREEARAAEMAPETEGEDTNLCAVMDAGCECESCCDECSCDTEK